MLVLQRKGPWFDPSLKNVDVYESMLHLVGASRSLRSVSQYLGEVEDEFHSRGGISNCVTIYYKFIIVNKLPVSLRHNLTSKLIIIQCRYFTNTRNVLFSA